MILWKVGSLFFVEEIDQWCTIFSIFNEGHPGLLKILLEGIYNGKNYLGWKILEYINQVVKYTLPTGCVGYAKMKTTSDWRAA